jgi:hypothetical protein
LNLHILTEKGTESKTKMEKEFMEKAKEREER